MLTIHMPHLVDFSRKMAQQYLPPFIINEH